MVRIEVELRLIEIEGDLSSLHRIQMTLEAQLKALADDHERQMWRELDESGQVSDEVEVDLARQLHEWEFDHSLPKAFRGSFVVLLWATYEAAIIEVAEFLQTIGRHELGPDDLRGYDVIARLRKYYDTVLRFPLHPPQTDFTHLTRLYAVRNAFAHANGRLSRMKKEIRKTVGTILDQKDGLEDSWGYIIPTSRFLEMSLEMVAKLLSDLVVRARKAHDDLVAPTATEVT